MYSIIFIENWKTHSPKKLEKNVFFVSARRKECQHLLWQVSSLSSIGISSICVWLTKAPRPYKVRQNFFYYSIQMYTNTNLCLTGKSDRISFIYLNCTAHFSLSDCRQDKRWNKILTWWFRRFVFLLYFCKFFHFLFGLTVVWSIGLQCSD